MDEAKILFTCPKCTQQFSLKEFKEHNSQAIFELVNERTQQELKLREAEIENKIKTDEEQKWKIQLNEVQQEHQQSLQKERDQITKLSHQIDQEKQTQALIAEQTKNKVEKQYQDQFNDYQAQIQKLKLDQEAQIKLSQERLAALKSSTEQAKNGELQLLTQQIKALEKQLADQKDKQILVVQTEKQTIEKQYQDQINSQQAEIQRLKQDQKSQLDLAQVNLDAQKAMITQAKDGEIQLLKQKIATLKSDYDNEAKTVLQAKELELSQKIHQLEKEKADLVLKNSENRVINNKIKGENFEHEVEGELRKAFGFNDNDVIEKITDADKKADYLQVVRNDQKKELGRIVYEVKNAEWSDRWEAKLVEDTAKQKARYGILVATKFNDKYHDVPFVKSSENDNIYLTDPNSFIFVAQILRKMMENENYYKQKIKELDVSEQDGIFLQYKKIYEALDGFLSKTLPEFKKKFDLQLEAILKVSGNLNRQAETLEKAHNTLRKEYSKRIAEELQKISTI